MSKSYPKLKFLLILIVVALLCVGWAKHISLVKYSSTIFQSLSHHSNYPAVGNSVILKGSYHEVSIPPNQSAQYLSADYRLWIPDKVKAIRGVIVRQHGCGDDAAATGLEHANDLQWQTLAAKHQFALLGTKILSGDRPCESWALINYGSGNAFLQALRGLAEKSRHLEIIDAPWVLWGHSGGSDWAAQMLQEYSTRTIAMVGMRCGGFTFFGSNPNLVGIPILFALGEKEPTADECLKLPQQVFSRYRQMNAVWAFAVEAKTGHESGETRFLSIPYLDAVIAERLDSKDGKLVPIEAKQGWLGHPITHEIYPTKNYAGKPLEAVWLPNEEVARKWQEYVSTGKILPTRKPAAPTNVQVLKNTEKQTVINWDFTPDLENGLPSFRIYRDNSLVATIKGQDHNFGDAPDPVNVSLEYVDKNAQNRASYTVAAFNEIGESASESTPLKEKGSL